MKKDAKLIIKLDAKAKRLIRKNALRTCAYIYRDGIVVSGEEVHHHKGKRYSDDFNLVYPFVNIPIYVTHKDADGKDKFDGRLVIHDPSVLLDGIDRIEIYYGNTTDKMKHMNLSCNTVTIFTNSGIRISQDIFHFMSSIITIQNGKKMSVHDVPAGAV